MKLPLDPIARFLMITGILLLLGGIAWQFGWIQSLKLGRLPGDIVIERDHMRFYFPITTGILISILLSLFSWLFR